MIWLSHLLNPCSQHDKISNCCLFSFCLYPLPSPSQATSVLRAGGREQGNSLGPSAHGDLSQSDTGHPVLTCPRMNSGAVSLCLLGQILYKDAHGMLVFLSPLGSSLTCRPLGQVFTGVAMSPSSPQRCIISCVGK